MFQLWFGRLVDLTCEALHEPHSPQPSPQPKCGGGGLSGREVCVLCVCASPVEHSHSVHIRQRQEKKIHLENKSVC